MLSLSSQSECVPERPCDAQKKEQDRVPNVVKKEFSQVPHVPFVAEGGFINHSPSAKPIGRILCVPNMFPSSHQTEVSLRCIVCEASFGTLRGIVLMVLVDRN